MMSVFSCTPFPLPTPCDDMLVCATRWLYMHLYTLAYMSMHESCLLVCRPCFNTMKLWEFDPNLHLSLADTTFLSTFLLISLLPCWLAILLLSHVMPDISILLVFLAPFCHYLHISFFPLLACWFIVFAFACTHMERGHTELGHGLPGARKKGTDASM